MFFLFKFFWGTCSCGVSAKNLNGVSFLHSFGSIFFFNVLLLVCVSFFGLVWFFYIFFWSLEFLFFFFNFVVAMLAGSMWHINSGLALVATLFLYRGDHTAPNVFFDRPLEVTGFSSGAAFGDSSVFFLCLVAAALALQHNFRGTPHRLILYNLPYNLNNIFLNPRGFFFNFLEKWVFTTNHKRVGINYMWYGVIAGVVATFFATVIKLELGEPGSLYCGGNMRIYLSVVTGHAVVMVFLTYVPIYYGAFTNYLIPVQLGARDFAYPRLNNFSFWVFPPSLFFFVSALLKHQGLLTGWTFYPPLSGKKYSPDFNMDITILSVVLIAVGSLISTSNLISTFRYMRGASLKADYRYIPLSVYGTLFGAVLFTMVAPVLGVAMVMLYLDRHGITNYFNVSRGGDVVLYQHIFWFFGHPEVYVLILPTFGYVSNIVVFSAKQNILTYDHMVISMFAICLLGMIVWGHHMYVGGLNRGMKNMFSATSLFVSIPSTLKIHSWVVTLQTGSIFFSVQLLFLFSFLVGIILGGITGMVLGVAGFDVLYHDTYYVVGHFHLVLSMGGFSIIFAVIYHYWFIFFRTRYNKFFAVLHFLSFFFGELLTFVPALFLGMSGMPRRINDYPMVFSGWHGLSSLGHGFVVISLFFFFFVVVESKFVGETFLFSDRFSLGVPYFANRVSVYFVLIAELRRKRGVGSRGRLGSGAVYGKLI